MPVHRVLDVPTVVGRELFVGRWEVLVRLTEMLAQARAGSPRLALVEGPAGIGKTALVQRFLVDTMGTIDPVDTEGTCVLRASGDEDETGLQFGVLTQLLADASAVSTVPVDGGAGRFGADERPADPLVAGAALVDLLGELQQRSGAVVLVVDDAQWADRESLQALTFAVRRLRVDRVLAVVVTRDVTDSRLPDGLRRMLSADFATWLRLDGLDVTELRDLSGQLCPRPLSRRGAARLRAHTGGSPLHARALLEQVPAAAFDDPDVPLPAPRSFAMLVTARLAGCEPDVERLVTAASVLGMHAPVQLAAAVAGVDEPLGAWERAMAAGLLAERLTERSVSFPHPLVHAAVYGQLGPARRAELHLRAADRAEDEAVRLRHRARAASGADAALAGDLAELGRRQAVAGTWASAADHLATAARLTPHRADREQFVLEGLECGLLVGGVGDLADVADRLRGFTATGWRNYVLARLALFGGAFEECETLLHDAWDRYDSEEDPALGTRIASHIALLYGNQMRGEQAALWADRALRFAPDHTATDMVRYLRLTAQATTGRTGPALATLADLPDPALASDAELEELLGRGVLRLYADDLGAALRDFRGVLAASHDRSATFRWVAAGHLGMTEFLAGRWDDALVHGELALSIATDADQAHLALFGHVVVSLVRAARGEWAAAEAHARVLRDAATGGYPQQAALAAIPHAHLARARGVPEAVVEAIEPLLRPEFRHVIENPGVAWHVVLYFDALVMMGELDRAETALGPYEALATERDHASALAAAGRVRANLAAARGDEATAERHFTAALAHAGRTDMAFDQALLRLAYGRFLRRAGRRAHAGAQLRQARDVFANLGAQPDLQRCEQELAACGLSVGPRRTRDAAVLTPQELAVARLAADGLTNRQVARELVLSVKTVEYHPGHVYAKLDVTSRVQLPRRLSEDQN